MKETNDLTAKNFMAFPDVAADAVNVLMYNGQPVASAGRLWPAPTESIYQGKEKIRSQYEDVEKYEVVDGEINVLYLFANQTKADGGMLLRKAGYTGGAYREQYDGKTSGTYPVVELILYWGKKRWDGSRSMRQMFRKKKLPEKAWRYIDDLRLHVFEMRHLDPETRRLFTSDLRIVADYLAEGNSYRSEQKVVHKEALVKFLRALSGDRNVEDTAKILTEMDIREEDEITVCELFDQYTRRGIRQGVKQGVKQGIEALITSCRELGISFDATADKVGEKFHLRESEVKENMSLYW